MMINTDTLVSITDATQNFPAWLEWSMKMEPQSS